MEDKHVQPISPDVPAQAQTRIDKANALLVPYLPPLTPQEQFELTEMDNKALCFSKKNVISQEKLQ
jgi:hypothetical protein